MIEDQHLFNLLVVVGLGLIVIVLMLLFWIITELKSIVISTNQDILNACDDSINITKNRFQAIIDVIRFIKKNSKDEKPTENTGGNY